MKYFILLLSIVFLINDIGFIGCDLNIKTNIGINGFNRKDKNNNNDIFNDLIGGDEKHHFIPSLIPKRDLSKCPCSDASLCNIITKPPAKEFIGFGMINELSFYQNYVNWTTITTLSISLTNTTDPQIICLAHQHGVRVIHRTLFPSNGWEYNNQNMWLTSTLSLLNQYYVDGVTLDFEMRVANKTLTKELSTLVLRISESLNMMSPYLVLSYCIDTSLEHIDYTIISKSLDYFIVMAYDMSWNSNPLGSNSPFPVVSESINTLIKKGIDANQLVLALPWYGYYGKCIDPIGILNSTCNTINYPSPLSVTYATIYKILNTYPNSGELWDSQSMTPYLNYIYHNSIYQIQYDNPISIYYKVQFAKSSALRGVGVWALDDLNTLPYGPVESSLWDAFHSFF